MVMNASGRCSEDYRTFLDSEIDQIALDTVRAGWGNRWRRPTAIVHGEAASTIEDWVRLRTEPIYAYPGQMPPRPAVPWLNPFLVAFFGVPLFLLGLLIGDQPALQVLILTSTVGIWSYACLRNAYYRSATRNYWAEHDPERAERTRFIEMLEFDLKGALEWTANEFDKPIVTIPPLDVDKAPRRELPWDPCGPRPEPIERCSPRQAEYLARDWMAYLGASGARVSPATRDGGADVIAEHFVAEVKHRAVPSSPDLVRQIFGVATAEHKRALFFSLNGYSNAAVEFADKANVALFEYDPKGGTIAAKSAVARSALKTGLNT